MAATGPAMKPVLQKPPGFRDPNGKPVPRPPQLRKAALPPSFQPRKRRKNYGHLCCCILLIILLILLFVLIILAGVFYLWFDPKLPVFHLSLKMSTFKVATKPDGTYFNAVTVARVEVRNPNSKLTYRYGGSEVEMTLGRDQGTQLGSMNLPGFVQGAKNTTSLKIETSVKNKLIEDGVGSRIKSQFKSKELVVNVHVTTKVGVDVQGLNIGMLGVDVSCDGVTLKQINGGDMPMCSIRTLKWININ